MISLFLDLSIAPEVALVKDNKQIVKLTQSGEHNSDKVMELIDSVLNQAKIKIENIDYMVLNIGPGSFTGLRVAVAIAKGLGFSSSLKFKTYTSFDIINNSENAAVIVKGFSNFVYLKDQEDMSCVEIDNLKKSKNYITTDEQTYNDLKNLGLKVSLKKPLKYNEISNLREVSLGDLSPLYIRKSQAELQREQSLKNAKSNKK